MSVQWEKEIVINTMMMISAAMNSIPVATSKRLHSHLLLKRARP
jgi:hypothetical protein